MAEFPPDRTIVLAAEWPLARPFIPHPNIGKPFGIDGIKFEITADKPLETIPEIPV
jgi:hypothetical protein